MNKKKRIMSINMNDFGGKNEHLMNHRYFNNRDRKYQIDWKYWAKQVKKDETWNSLKEYILDKQPDLLVIEEMLISCYESIDFIGELEEIGYSYIEDCLPERGNYSLTMIFFRDGNPKYIHSPGKYRENRSVVCKEDDLLICGSHFPCESDEVFLNHMENFVTDYLNDDFLLVGDLNANDQTRGNKKMINRLLDKGAVDLWVMFGNDENTPTEAQYQGRLDYAIASPSLTKKVKNIEIDPFLMNAGVTDHAAIIVDINE
ncbi:endonuclease/exonuclease/phosphatase family protein [Dorea formicigenerans]|nr:endonuclease/exonuclease/phosphatase family protein [Dorea formicigenerans]